MVKLVDTRDLKSLARKGVPVRLRLRAPIQNPRLAMLDEGFFIFKFNYFSLNLIIFHSIFNLHCGKFVAMDLNYEKFQKNEFHSL